MWPSIKRKLNQWKGTLIIVPCVAGLIIAGSQGGIFRVLEWMVQDQLIHWRAKEAQDDRIVIVTIDESDIAYAKRWPMSDQMMAQMIRNISVQSPRAIAIDIYRDLPVEPGHAELVKVFQTTPNFIGIQKVAGNPIAPPPALQELGQVAANDLLIDADGKVRRGVVILGTPEGTLLQGLGVKMAMTYLVEDGIELEAIDDSKQIYGLGQAEFVPLASGDGSYTAEDMGGYQILMNYRGGLAKFPHISMEDVLEQRIPDDFMRDRLVFIGAKAPSLNDNYATPYNSTLDATRELMPGVVIHANVTSQVLSAAAGDRPMLRATATPFNWFWIILWTSSSASFGAIFLYKKRLTLLGLVTCSGIIILSAWISFSAGWIIPVFTPLLALGSAAIGSIGLVLWQNLMLSYRQLEDYAHNLEDKVEARTSELAQANDEIRALNEKLKAENLRMGAELDVARQLQQLVLPRSNELKSIEGLDIAGFMEPADEIGGDYYDVLYLDGIVTLGIGDVTGHGLESGILMLMTQTAVRTLQEIQERDPVKFLDALNRTIYRNVQRMDSEKNLTLAILNYAHGQLSISGQHEETLVVRSNGEIERIDTMDLGLPIGLDDDIADFIDHTTVELNAGDGVVLYTDGIPEAYNIDKKQYEMDRMLDVISRSWSGSAEEIKQAIIDDVRRFIGEQKVFDDITLLVIKQE